MWSSKQHQRYSGVDSGFNHNPPMLYGSQHQIDNISIPKEKNDSIP
jgi:diaminopimelate decarboxylase